MKRDVLGFLASVAADYGDVAGFKVGNINVVLLNRPELVRDVLQTNSRNFVKGRPLYLAKQLLGEGLLTSEGECHAEQSRTVQPALQTERIKGYGAVMTECAERWSSDWRHGDRRDMMRELTGLATTISARTLFQWEVGVLEAVSIATALEEASRLFARAPVPLTEWLLKLPLPSSRRFHRAKSHLDQVTYDLIADRRTHPREQTDALSMLLAAQSSGGQSDQLVRDQALTLFLTALDTTSLALTWTLYVLSQHPVEETELHAELDRVLADHPPAVTDIEQLPYTRMIFLEAMRLYPPIYAIAREAVAAFRVDGYDVPAGSLVLMSPYIMQRDARNFREPERFLPRRWSADSPRPPGFSYFPFGGGPRGCIGQSYAMLEGVLVLAALARGWRFRLAPGHPVELRPLINLRPMHGMQMVLEQRPRTEA